MSNSTKHDSLIRWNIYAFVFLMVLIILHPLVLRPKKIFEGSIFFPKYPVITTTNTIKSKPIRWLGWHLPWQGKMLGTIKITQRIPQFPMPLALRHRVDQQTQKRAKALAAQYGANAIWTEKNFYYRLRGNIVHLYRGQALRLPISMLSHTRLKRHA